MYPDYSSQINKLPFTLQIMFAAVALLAVILLIRATNTSEKHKRAALFTIVVWILITGFAGVAGVYENFESFPPRLVLFGVLPALLITFYVVFAQRPFILNLSLTHLTWIHVVRIPVEFGLYLLFMGKAVPEDMTFEGRNLDILSGLSALVILYLLHKKKISGQVLFVWNLLCLGLLINIVYTAIIATPFPQLQSIGHNQPNIAVFYFPYSLLPTVIVPTVLFAHLAAIRKLSATQGMLGK